jgi:hypothetical protein
MTVCRECGGTFEQDRPDDAPHRLETDTCDLCLIRILQWRFDHYPRNWLEESAAMTPDERRKALRL